MQYILVADDEPGIRQLLAESLGKRYEVVTVATGKQLYAIATTCREEIACIVADWIMPGWDGVEAVKLAEAMGSRPPIVWITGQPEGLRQALNGRGGVILQKPFSTLALLSAVREAVERDS